MGRRLAERLLEAGKWEEATPLLLWGPWRYRGGATAAGIGEREAALAAKLEDAAAPDALRLKLALSSPAWESVRRPAIQGLPAHPLFHPRALAADDALLALAAAALLPPPGSAAAPDDHPWPLLYSPAWRVLADALLLRARRLPPPPLPASVSFAAARLVAGQAHLQAAALVAEARGLHPSLRTAEGALSLLWATLCAPWPRSQQEVPGTGAQGEEKAGEVESESARLWDGVRAQARAVLEADETE